MADNLAVGVAEVKIEATRANAILDALEKKLNDLERKTVNLKVEVDKNSLKTLKNPEIEADLKFSKTQIERELASIRNPKVEVDIDIDSATAKAKLKEVTKDQKVEVKVDVDKNVNFSKLAKEFSQFGSQLSKGAGQFQLGNLINAGGQGVGLLSSSFKELQTSALGAGSAVGGAGGAIGGLSAAAPAAASIGALSIGFIGLISAATGAVVALGAVGAAFEATKFAVEASGELEGAIRGMVLTEVEDLGTLGAEVAAFAAKTPFTLESALKNTTKLLRVGFDTKDAVKSVKLFADAVSLTGGTTKNFENVITSVQKLFGRGVLQQRTITELIRNAPAITQGSIFSELSQVTGIATDQLAKSIKKNEIGAAEGFIAIQRAAEKIPGVIGASAIQMDTLTGKIVNLKDILQTVSLVGFSDFLRSFKGAFDQQITLPLADAFLKIGPAVGQTFDQIKNFIGPTISTIGDFVAGIAGRVGPVIQALLANVQAFFRGMSTDDFGAGFESIGATLSSLIPLAQGFGKVVSISFRTGAEVVESFIGAVLTLSDVVQGVFSTIISMGEALAALVAGAAGSDKAGDLFKRSGKSFDDATRSFRSAFDRITGKKEFDLTPFTSQDLSKQILSKRLSALTEGFGKEFEKIKNDVMGVNGSFNALGENKSISNFFRSIGADAETTADQIEEVGKAFDDLLKENEKAFKIDFKPADIIGDSLKKGLKGDKLFDTVFKEFASQINFQREIADLQKQGLGGLAGVAKDLGLEKFNALKLQLGVDKFKELNTAIENTRSAVDELVSALTLLQFANNPFFSTDLIRSIGQENGVSDNSIKQALQANILQKSKNISLDLLAEFDIAASSENITKFKNELAEKFKIPIEVFSKATTAGAVANIQGFINAARQVVSEPITQPIDIEILTNKFEDIQSALAPVLEQIPKEFRIPVILQVRKEALTKVIEDLNTQREVVKKDFGAEQDALKKIELKEQLVSLDVQLNVAQSELDKINQSLNPGGAPKEVPIQPVIKAPKVEGAKTSSANLSKGGTGNILDFFGINLTSNPSTLSPTITPNVDTAPAKEQLAPLEQPKEAKIKVTADTSPVNTAMANVRSVIASLPARLPIFVDTTPAIAGIAGLRLGLALNPLRVGLTVDTSALALAQARIRAVAAGISAIRGFREGGVVDSTGIYRVQEAGREMLRLPSGQLAYPNMSGRETIMALPKGTEVLNNASTKRMEASLKNNSAHTTTVVQSRLHPNDVKMLAKEITKTQGRYQPTDTDALADATGQAVAYYSKTPRIRRNFRNLPS